MGTSLIDLTGDPVELTAALVDVPSVSGQERALADVIEGALREQAPHLEVLRSGNAVLARTPARSAAGSAAGSDAAGRVLLAGHIDTVPVAGNLPARRDNGVIHGCGTSDMKSGVAVIAHLAATITSPRHPLTVVFYDCEEVEANRNGLGRIEREQPEWLAADLAVLGEPTDGVVEAGCQGTMRAEVTTSGHRAHSARAWLGRNAIHAAAEVLQRLREYRPRTVEIDGCTYREGLQAVGIDGGVAGNVVPDECRTTVNLRFAPDRDPAAAEDHLREVFDGFEVKIVDAAAGALPGLAAPRAAEFLALTGAMPTAKYGWTDVARFAARGVPALNFGPGDPNLAHTREEHVRVDKITEVAATLRRFLDR